MLAYVRHQKRKFLFPAITRLIVFVLSFSLVFSPTAGYAQSVLNLPVPGVMIAPSPAFVPVLLKGMTIHPEDPFRFDFIVDSGNTDFTQDEIKKESEKLVKYFLAAMTIPKDDLWVNLSPYEEDRIIPEELGKTELGRDMLAQDYILKQLTASLMYPEEELGQKFWDKVYAKAEEQFGTSEIPVNTFNKVWILPETATVYEHEQTVYIVNAHLKVMLDSDYTAMQGANGNTPVQDESLEVSESIIREIIIPEIEREVNQGEHFASLRQIYHSLILAKWYKETVKNSLLNQVYADKNKIDGVDVDDSTLKDQIYTQYMEAYKKGVFNYIKEDYDRLSNETIPRKYFSGGEMFVSSPIKQTFNPGAIQDLTGHRGLLAKVEIVGQDNGKDIVLPEPEELPAAASPIKSSDQLSVISHQDISSPESRTVDDEKNPVISPLTNNDLAVLLQNFRQGFTNVHPDALNLIRVEANALETQNIEWVLRSIFGKNSSEMVSDEEVKLLLENGEIDTAMILYSPVLRRDNVLHPNRLKKDTHIKGGIKVYTPALGESVISKLIADLEDEFDVMNEISKYKNAGKRLSVVGKYVGGLIPGLLVAQKLGLPFDTMTKRPFYFGYWYTIRLISYSSFSRTLASYRFQGA